MVDLNSLVSPQAGWTLETANAINNSGDIVGFGVNPAGAQEPFLLMPVPEPGGMAMLLGAGAMIVARRRHDRSAAC